MKTDEAGKKYADIIDLQYIKSKRRRHMALYDRAAQFAPFAALTGYDDMVREEARLTDSRAELSEYELEELDRQCAVLQSMLEKGEKPRVRIRCFIPDKHKSGGCYKTFLGIVKEIDITGRRLILYGSDNTEDRRTAPIETDFDMIYSISPD